MRLRVSFIVILVVLLSVFMVSSVMAVQQWGTLSSDDFQINPGDDFNGNYQIDPAANILFSGTVDNSGGTDGYGCQNISYSYDFNGFENRSVEVRFKRSTKGALTIYLESGDGALIGLHTNSDDYPGDVFWVCNGQGRCSYHCGDYAEGWLGSPYNIGTVLNNNQWHTLRITKEDDSVIFSVDNGEYYKEVTTAYGCVGNSPVSDLDFSGLVSLNINPSSCTWKSGDLSYEIGTVRISGGSQSNVSLPVPNAPFLKGDINGQDVTLSWNKVSYASSYTLCYYANNDDISSWTCGNLGNTTKFSAKNLAVGAKYQVKVYAENSSGKSGDSNTVIFEPKAKDDNIIIFTIDGLSFTKIAIPLESRKLRASYLKPVLESVDMHLNVKSDNIHNFDWTGDANYTEKYIVDLIDELVASYLKASREQKKFVIVSHSWGTMLAAFAIGSIQANADFSFKPDLWITLSCPIGAHYNDKQQDVNFFSYHTGSYANDAAVLLAQGAQLISPSELTISLWFDDNVTDTLLPDWLFVSPQNVDGVEAMITGYIMKEYLDSKNEVKRVLGWDDFVLPAANKWINFWAEGDVISGPTNNFSSAVYEQGKTDIQIDKDNPATRDIYNTRVWHEITSLDVDLTKLNDNDKKIAIKLKEDVAKAINALNN